MRADDTDGGVAGATKPADAIPVGPWPDEEYVVPSNQFDLSTTMPTGQMLTCLACESGGRDSTAMCTMARAITTRTTCAMHATPYVSCADMILVCVSPTASERVGSA